MTILVIATITRPTRIVLLVTILAVSIIGGIIEVFQPYFDRTFSLTDLLANIAGATLASTVYYSLAVSHATARDKSS
jgi:VanZ family protein